MGARDSPLAPRVCHEMWPLQIANCSEKLVMRDGATSFFQWTNGIITAGQTRWISIRTKWTKVISSHAHFVVQTSHAGLQMLQVYWIWPEWNSAFKSTVVYFR